MKILALLVCGLVGLQAATFTPIALHEGGPFDDGLAEISGGDQVTYSLRPYVGDFFGKETIHANPEVANTTDAQLTTVFAIAFFDADQRLVACASQSTDLDAGESTSLGSCLMFTPPGLYKKVASYQVTCTSFPTPADE